VFDEAMAAFGKVDILVNNAGESRTGAFEEITDGHLAAVSPAGLPPRPPASRCGGSGRDIRPPSGNLNLEHAPMAPLSLAR
jgi:NAD(P)-dependent dehydrogenase (short-subunit alcohol dehydrogenase family)